MDWLRAVFDWRDILPLSAIFISLLSIIVSWLMLRQKVRHDQLSVKPIPRIALDDFEDEINIYIRNDGTGPLIIKELEVYDSNSGNPSKDLYSICPDMPNGLDFSDYTGDFKNRAVSVGGKLNIIKIEFDEEDKEEANYRDELREFLKDVSFKLYYTDIYGNGLGSPYSRSCDEWFGRHNIKPAKHKYSQ